MGKKPREFRIAEAKGRQNFRETMMNRNVRPCREPGDGEDRGTILAIMVTSKKAISGMTPEQNN